MPAALGLGSLHDHAHCVSSRLPPRLLLLQPDPTSTMAPHKPLTLRSNLATTPSRTSSNKQSQPRHPAELQTPLPSRPALRGEDRTPTPAQPSPGKAHPAPQRQCCVLERVNLHSGCSPEPRGCQAGGEARGTRGTRSATAPLAAAFPPPRCPRGEERPRAPLQLPAALLGVHRAAAGQRNLYKARLDGSHKR